MSNENKNSGRNAYDVALELTRLHLNSYAISENEIETIFAKYYAIAKVLSRSNKEQLKNLVPVEILNEIE